MAKSDVNQARLAEYRQEQKVTRLRQQLYSQADPSKSATLAEELIAAEETLASLEEARRQAEGTAGRGVLLDTGREEVKPGGRVMSKETTGIDVRVVQRMSHVPSGIVHLLDKDKHPLVSFHIGYEGRKNYVRLRIASWVEGYSARAVQTLELNQGDKDEVDQLPSFFPDRLGAVTELSRATLHIEIDDLDNKAEQHSSFPIWLLARTTMCYGVEDPSTGDWTDLTPYYGAWVTPNAPEVMQVLRSATALHPDKAMGGYQVSPENVTEQVRAVYNALKAQQVEYVHSVLCFGSLKGQYMQRVRLPGESLRNKSANCIDGTVLMASILEAASLNPALVLVPAHAFLAWETWEDSGKWDYLETTMIGSEDFEAACKSGRSQAAEWKKSRKKLKDPYQFRLLPLAEVRAEHGITPMA
jgi:hypothetical protein